MLFGDILIRRGIGTEEQIQGALEAQLTSLPRRRLGEILLAEGIITELDILYALGEQMGIEVLEQVDSSLLDSTLVEKLPVDWARTNHMLPAKRGEEVLLLMSDPLKLSEQEELSLLLGMEPTPVLALLEDIRRSIEQCYFQKKDSARDLIDQLGASAEVDAARAYQKDDLLRSADDAPVTQLVNLILLDAIKAGASDIHIEPFENRLRIRFRIDGVLYEEPSPQKNFESAVSSRLKIMAKLDIAEKRLPQDGTARVRVGDRDIDIRVSTVPVAEGERIVLRLLNRESALLSLEELGMSPGVHARFRSLIREPNGVIWVTGPTGSGKTTTLYAALQEFDTGALNVLTIEDPIEYQLPDIGQMSVKEKIGLTFGRGLRHILRQDPDVILVGETRDLETAEIVTRASLTGHLVFSTLHTNDAVSAILRLTDMGIEPYLVASATRAATAQRLLRKLCPRCKCEAELSGEQITALGGKSRVFEGCTVFAPMGCGECTGGYRGRTACFEIMLVDDEVRDVIRSGYGLRELRDVFQKQDAVSLADDACGKALEGVTSVDEVIRVLGRGTAWAE
ncbi:MAG: Flp pilus assembly complex ATPase component TadA [Verrucomicrobia bacterium]|nr:Flp pilus assembly complex ATPase component TadA [Verrucomicrobiota bacterium]